MALRHVRVPFEKNPAARAFQQSLSARRTEEDRAPDRDLSIVPGLRVDTTVSTDIRVPTFLGRRARGWQIATQGAPGHFHEIGRDMRTVTLRYTPPAGVTTTTFALRVW